MEYPKHYQILELPISATDKEIKAQYRRLAKKYHPDLHQNDRQAEEMFKQITEAYKILSDAQKRKSYDQSWQAQRDEELQKQKKCQKQQKIDSSDSLVVKNDAYRQQIHNYKIKAAKRIIRMFLLLTILCILLFSTTVNNFPQFLQAYNNGFEKTVLFTDKAVKSTYLKAQKMYNSIHQEPIISAIKNSDTVGVLEYLSRQGNPNFVDKSTNYSLLMLSDNPEIVQMLIGYGADVNYIATDGKNALLLAVEADNTALAELLISAGADVNYLQKNTKYSLLMLAKSLKMYYILLQNGANPNHIAADGKTALLLAASRNDMQRINALRQYGVNITWSDAAAKDENLQHVN